MTVQELIDRLQQIEDKTKSVCCILGADIFYVFSVDEHMNYVFLKEWEPKKKES